MLNLPIGKEIHITRYMKFIYSRKSPQKRKKGYDKHHIIPKALGGTDEKINLIYLTLREHFIAHLILWKAYGGKMTTAFWMMNNGIKVSTGKHGRKLISKQYECLRIEQAKESSKTNKGKLVGEKNPMFGKKQTEEWLSWARCYYIAENNPNFGKQGNLGCSWEWTIQQKENLKRKREKQTPYQRHKNTGRKWMINKVTTHQCIVDIEEISKYEALGYILGRNEPKKIGEK